MRSQLAHILGAWVFAQALLDVYGYMGNLAMGSPHKGPLTTKQTGSMSNVAALCPEEDMLVDSGFFAQSSFSKEAKAAAQEVLVRVLETGPSSLEPVKEAVGALRALAAGVFWHTTPKICQRNACSVQQAIELVVWCAAWWNAPGCACGIFVRLVHAYMLAETHGLVW